MGEGLAVQQLTMIKVLQSKTVIKNYDFENTSVFVCHLRGMFGMLLGTCSCFHVSSTRLSHTGQFLPSQSNILEGSSEYSFTPLTGLQAITAASGCYGESTEFGPYLNSY